MGSKTRMNAGGSSPILIGFAVLATAAALVLTAAAFAAEPDPNVDAKVAAAVGATAADSIGTAISGAWILNEKLSDDPEDVIKEAIKSKGGGRGGGMDGGRGDSRGGGMGGGRGGGMGGGRGGGMSADLGGGRGEGSRGDALATMSEAMKTVEIFCAGPELNITDGRGNTALYFTDGRTSEIWTDRGKLVGTGVWRDGVLVVKNSGGRGGGQTREFRFDAETDRLTVVHQRSTPGGGVITIRTVYDRQSAQD